MKGGCCFFFFSGLAPSMLVEVIGVNLSIYVGSPYCSLKEETSMDPDENVASRGVCSVEMIGFMDWSGIFPGRLFLLFLFLSSFLFLLLYSFFLHLVPFFREFFYILVTFLFTSSFLLSGCPYSSVTEVLTCCHDPHHVLSASYSGVPVMFVVRFRY